MSTLELQFSQKGYVDKIGMQRATQFINHLLEEYDTSLIEWIKLLPLDKKHILHGECAYPVKNAENKNLIKKGYRIRASVNVESNPPYRFSHWGRIPSNTHKQGWHSGEKVFSWDTLEEVAVHALAHECFHFLSHSKQVKMKNTEANANWWADGWLEDFRAKYADLLD